MNHRPFKSSEPCARCKEAERRPYSDYCAPCREVVTKEHQKAYYRTVRKPRRKQDQSEKPKLRGDHGDRFGLKPHRPEPAPPRAPLISEAEQKQLNAEMSRRDSENHRHYCAAMGLVCVPDRPLASPVRMLSLEEVKRLEGVYQPPEKVTGGAMLPLRADMVYY
jgi:hypothetical protein